MSTLWHQWWQLILLNEGPLDFTPGLSPAVSCSPLCVSDKNRWHSPNFQRELSTALSFPMAGVKEMAFWSELLESSTCLTLYPLEQEMQNQKLQFQQKLGAEKKHHKTDTTHAWWNMLLAKDGHVSLKRWYRFDKVPHNIKTLQSNKAMEKFQIQ